MKTYTNNTAGMRGITVNSATGPYTHYLDVGASVELDPKLVIAVPDLGEAKAEPVDADDAELVASVQAENATLTERVKVLEAENATLKADLAKATGPDYERDDLGKLDLHKASTSKDQLLVIAAYEQAEVPEGDDATKADLIKAIEAKRAG